MDLRLTNMAVTFMYCRTSVRKTNQLFRGMWYGLENTKPLLEHRVPVDFDALGHVQENTNEG